MFRNSTRPFYWIGLLLLFSLNVQAQTKPSALKKIYLQGGMGPTTSSGVVGGIAVQSVWKNNWTVSASYQDFSLNPNNLPKDYEPDIALFIAMYPENNLVSFSLSGGKLFELGRKTWITTEAGISMVKGQEFTFQPQSGGFWIIGSTSNYDETSTDKSTVGGLLRADFTWAFASFAGLGVGTFANINSIQSPVGVEFKLVLGWMNRKPKQQAANL
ncbi:hypothetical protein [Flavisolibacter tropicus]|uniref:Outer membrane protein beta-barrel domain-containing protein n=1 Tax=Flavisolibacter tropicus TaxID=1492898 RepID=A0A172TYV6_9BACT|nr:hypothetical protein [Flavisolibacter tropicus]ANE52291.1 hypothetical protein SY85_19180 [Flavisolibacter tropicus]